VRERATFGAETTLAWPAVLAADEQGRIQVRFPDFPEALTDGGDAAEALAEAADCLAEAVAARIADGEDLPAPSRVRRGMHPIALPPLLAYKAALYGVMRRDRISKSELARRLGVDEKDVRRLVDPRYRGAKVERLHQALAACRVATRLTVADIAGRDREPGGSARPGHAAIERNPTAGKRRVG
jgi:antitoxin HicB